jgi:hypothetical protein
MAKGTEKVGVDMSFKLFRESCHGTKDLGALGVCDRVHWTTLVFDLGAREILYAMLLR